MREHQGPAISGYVDIAVGAFTQDFLQRAAVNRKRIDRTATAVLGTEENPFAVSRESELIHIGIERLRDRFRGSRFAVIEHQAKPIAFIARSNLRTVSDVAAIS